MAIGFRGMGVGGQASPPLPAGWQPGDLHLLFVETANEPPAAPAGYTQLASSPQGTGVAADVAATCLSVFYRVAVAGDTNASIAGTPNHYVSFILGFAGVDQTTPIDSVPAGTVEATASTAVTYPEVTTATANAWVVFAASHAADDSVQQATAATFAGLADVTNAGWYHIVPGNGGGIYSFFGTKAAAGATGTGSSTFGVASTQGRITVALRPDPAVGAFVTARPQVFVCT